MNLNYDIITWIQYFIGAFICCLGGVLIGKILLRKQFKDIKKTRLLLLIPLTIFTIFNTLAFDNILKLFGVLLLNIVIYKFILEESGVRIFIYSFTTIILLSIGEILYVLLVSICDYLFKFPLTNEITKAINTNFMIAIISCLVTYFLRKIINPYIEKLKELNTLIIILQGLFTIIIIVSSINYIYIEKWQFSYKFILVTLIIIGSSYLTFILMKQYLKNKEVTDKHKMLQEYLKTSADLIEKYSSTLHKYKNNLIVVKGYIKTDILEANNYINSLLEKIEDKKYSWVKQINYISIDPIRYLIYYKLSKVEEMNLKIFVHVDKNIEKINFKNIKNNDLGHILDVLGEYFDNAIYASNESEEKELNFDLYKNNNKLVFNISNTYKGDIDLNSIIKNGYTTKGIGHGLGLYDVDKTIKDINILSNKYEIVNNYFVSTLYINIIEK